MCRLRLRGVLSSPSRRAGVLVSRRPAMTFFIVSRFLRLFFSRCAITTLIMVKVKYQLRKLIETGAFLSTAAI